MWFGTTGECIGPPLQDSAQEEVNHKAMASFHGDGPYCDFQRAGLQAELGDGIRRYQGADNATNAIGSWQQVCLATMLRILTESGAARKPIGF